MYEATLGTSMLGEILGPRSSWTNKDLRGRHRPRLLEIASTLGEVLGDGRYPSQYARKGTLLQSFNIGKAADLSSEGALAREPVSEEHFFSQANFPFLFSSRGQIRVRFVKLLHTSSTKATTSPARHVSHFGRVSPSFPFVPTCPLSYSPISELGRSGPCRSPEGPRLSFLGYVEQDGRAKAGRRCRTSHEIRGTRYHSRIRFVRAGLRR